MITKTVCLKKKSISRKIELKVKLFGLKRIKIENKKLWKLINIIILKIKKLKNYFYYYKLIIINY